MTRRVWIAAIVTGLFVAPSPADDKKLKIVMVGDSTMSSYPNPPKDRPDLTGWGQVFGERFTAAVTVDNHAASGRSTKSFVKEGRWAKALAAKPDFVVIQFGHNDQKDPTLTPEEGFRDQLRQYIDETKNSSPSQDSTRTGGFWSGCFEVMWNALE